MKKLSRFITAVAISLVFSHGVVPAEAATLQLKIKPSTNGYIMKDISTKLTVTGATQSTVYLWNSGSKKYLKFASTQGSASKTVTFRKTGVLKLKVQPNTGQAKVFTVKVYADYPVWSGVENYAGTNLPSSMYFNPPFDDEFDAPAKSNCVLVDLGIKTMQPNSTLSLTVMSNGLEPVSIDASINSAAVILDVPVKGDVVIQLSSGAGQTTYGPETKIGIVWTCFTKP